MTALASKSMASLSLSVRYRLSVTLSNDEIEEPLFVRRMRVEGGALAVDKYDDLMASKSLVRLEIWASYTPIRPEGNEAPVATPHTIV